MEHWLRALVGRLMGFFKTPQPSADRSRLMGMYLLGANRPSATGLQSAPTRERHNGRMPQTRRRE